MKISFTAETNYSFDVLHDEVTEAVNVYFGSRHYGDDLNSLIIGLICVKEQFVDFFKVRKPRYRREARQYIHRGTQINSEPRLLIYNIKLDYSKYILLQDIRTELANEILDSLQAIKDCKQIKDFEYEKFNLDFTNFFKKVDWL